MKRIIMAVVLAGMAGGAYAADFNDLQSFKALDVKADPTAVVVPMKGVPVKMGKEATYIIIPANSLPPAVQKRPSGNKQMYSRSGCEVSQPAGAVASVINDGDIKLWFWSVKYTLTNTDNVTITKEFTPMKRIPIMPGARVSIPLLGGERATGCGIEDIGLYEDGQSPILWPTEPTTPPTTTPPQQNYLTTCVIKGNKAIGTIYNHAGSSGSLSGTAYFRYYDSRGSELDSHSTHVSLILTTQWDSENIEDSRVPNRAEACALQVRMDQK